MGLMYTYKKPHGGWKGKIISTTTYKWSNNANIEQNITYKSRPQKIWRKQLYSTSNGNTATGMPMDIPGRGSGSVPIGCGNSLVTHIVSSNNQCQNLRGNKCRIQRSASTIVSNNYHSDTRSYLKQKLCTHINNNNKKFATRGSVDSSTRTLRVTNDNIINK